MCVPVAQLDRASDFGSEGLGFDSSRVRHFFIKNYSLFKYINTKETSFLQNFWIYIGLDLFFLVGALLCMVLVGIYGELSLLACCVLLIIVFSVMFKEAI